MQTDISIENEITKKQLASIYEASKGILYESKKMALNTARGTIIVKIKDIVSIIGDGNYSKIYLTNKEVLSASRTLLEFEKILSELPFERIHKSSIVNLNFIKTYNKNEEYVLMENEQKYLVSTSKRKTLQIRLSLLTIGHL